MNPAVIVKVSSSKKMIACLEKNTNGFIIMINEVLSQTFTWKLNEILNRYRYKLVT